MKSRKHHYQPASSIAIFSMIWGIGLIIGCLAAYLMRDSLYASLFHLYQSLSGKLQALEVNRSELFSLALGRHMKYLVILSVFGFTNIWKYYSRLFLVYAGFQNGLLLSFCIQMNGIPGFVGYLCFLMPEAILFCPAYLLAVHCIDGLNHAWYDTNEARRQILWNRFPAFVAIFILTVSGCLLEAAANPTLLRLYFR